MKTQIGPEMNLHPVGVVRNGIKEPMLTADEKGLKLKERMEKIKEYHHRTKDVISELVIKEELSDLLLGIEGFSHILVLYWPHLIAPERRGLKQVHPMGREDLPLQGIFATCSPDSHGQKCSSNQHPSIVRTGEVGGGGDQGEPAAHE